MSHHRLVRLGLGGALLLASAATAALPSSQATVLPSRTFFVSGPALGGAANGASADAFISSDGDVVAFTSVASNLLPQADGNGAVPDIYTRRFNSDDYRRVSVAPDGSAANAASADPVLTRTGGTVVFTSAASNLVTDDTNGKADIFLRHGTQPMERMSVASDRTQANGDSGQPDVSGDGRYVVFASAASNLVPHDTNNQIDVFLRDRATGETRLVSHAYSGGSADGRSSTPAIAQSGRYVTYESTASDIVHDDDNGIADVFLYDVRTGHTERVSVSSRGRGQNASVEAPFTQVSDVSDDGRFVVFDSDATNLVPADTNRDTDVFVRDTKKGRTERVSLNASRVQGNNDSFSPRITPNGRWVAFESFADNLVPAGDGPGEDIFVYDRSRGAPIIASVTADGKPRGKEAVPQLLQRPSLSRNAEAVAFGSTAPNLVGDRTGGAEGIFVRRMDAPEGVKLRVPHFVGRHGGLARFRADDPAALSFLCRIDRGPQFPCDATKGARIPRGLRNGRHRLRATPGGAGMLFAHESLTKHFRVDRRAPRTPRITHLGRRRISGRAHDRRHGAGIAGVTIAIGATTTKKNRCLYYSHGAFKHRSCKKPIYVDAKGKRSWHRRLPSTKRALFVLVRAVDSVGNTSSPAFRIRPAR